MTKHDDGIDKSDFDDVLNSDMVEGGEDEEISFAQQIKQDFSISITCDRKLTQEAADLIKLDYKNPIDGDPFMKITPYGRQQYFGCYVPEEYIITQNGVWWMQQKRDMRTGEMIDIPVKVCNSRFLPTGQFTSSDGTHIVELTFVNDELKFESLRVPLNATQGIKEWKDIIRKNNYSNLFITDNELKMVIDYIHMARMANLHEGGTAFKRGEVFTQTGWANKECTKFVLGNKMITKDIYGNIETQNAVFMDERNIGFEEKLIMRGTVKGWADAISSIVKNPIFRFKLYYDVATILLAPLGVSNSAFGLVGDTSIGKTFTLQCSTSMFGNPNAKGEGLIISGDISLTALNAYLTTLSDLPAPVDEITVMRDDTKKALTYAIGNGSESLRGTKEGDLRSHKKIRTNVTLTGEVDITSEFANNGANVRAFSCKSKPLPEMDPDRIDAIRKGILANYGHILPRVIVKFYKHQDEIANWYNFAVARLRNTTEDNIMRRKAEYFAAAEAGGVLLEKVFQDIGLPPEKTQTIIDEMWKSFVLETPDTPLGIKALTVAYHWAISHPANFLRGMQQPSEKNPAPIFGFFTYPPYKHDGEYEFIDFVPAELEKFLKDRGFENPKQILGYWRDHHISQGNTNKQSKGKFELTSKVGHYYAYGKAAENRKVVHVKMSKIKEFIESMDEDEKFDDASIDAYAHSILDDDFDGFDTPY